MSEKEGYRFKCHQCGNCCNDINTLVNLNYHDIIRIKDALDLTLEELLQIVGFYLIKGPLTEEQIKKMVVPPIETENGPAFVGLHKDKSGKCYFYDAEKKKCMIYKIRPMFCRTFPFSFKLLINQEDPTKAKIKMYPTDKAYEYCPGLKNDPPLIDEKEWIKIGKQTIEEMGDNNVLIENWNIAVREGKIEPSAKYFLITIFNLEEKKSASKQ